MSDWIKDRAEQALWDAGYIVIPGIGGSKVLCEVDGDKVAIARKQGLSHSWKVRRVGLGPWFRRSRVVVSASPHLGFAILLGLVVEGAASN